VLAALAALGAVLSAVMLEPRSPETEVEVAPEGAVELEAAA
jgi:hypothetical protein